MTGSAKPGRAGPGLQPGQDGSEARPHIAAEVERLAPDLFGRSGGVQFGLTAADFARTLEQVARKYLPSDATADDARELLSSLHVEELALARACAAGDDVAWEIFLTRYREKLYGAAYGIAKEEATARELADTLYADLYGTSTREGRRVSKLDSYTGRGSLEGWLRTVLAQEYVNRYRRGRRLVSLEEESEAGRQFAAAADARASVDHRLEAATAAALAELPPEDRFLLATYFLDQRTLAEIARMLGVHESTISRKVDRAVKTVRKGIRRGLVALGMSRRQADEALETDVRDVAVNVREKLAQETRGGTFSQQGIGADARNK